jgi:hypothetical protein
MDASPNAERLLGRRGVLEAVTQNPHNTQNPEPARTFLMSPAHRQGEKRDGGWSRALPASCPVIDYSESSQYSKISLG